MGKLDKDPEHKKRILRVGNFIVKVYRGRYFRLRSESEVYALRWLYRKQERLPFLAPREVLYLRTQKADFLVMEYLPLLPLDLETRTNAKRFFLLAFSSLTKLASLSEDEQVTTCNFFVSSPKEGLPFEVSRTCFDFLSQFVNGQEPRQFLHSLWKEFEAEKLQEDICLAHGGMRLRHWFWHERSHRIVVIDWETAHYFLCFADHARLLLDVFMRRPDLSLVALQSLDDSLKTISVVHALLYKFSLLWLSLSFLSSVKHEPLYPLQNLLTANTRRLTSQLSPFDFSLYIWEQVFRKVTFILPADY